MSIPEDATSVVYVITLEGLSNHSLMIEASQKVLQLQTRNCQLLFLSRSTHHLTVCCRFKPETLVWCSPHPVSDLNQQQTVKWLCVGEQSRGHSVEKMMWKRRAHNPDDIT